MARRTFNIIASSLISFLRRLRPNIDTKPGTFTRDVIIDAPANEFDGMYRAVENVSDAQSPDLATSQALDNLARNLQSKRRGAQRATGQITFYRIASPSTAITIPRGITVSSKGSLQEAPRQFLTIQSATLSITNFNPATGRFEVTVPIRADQGGADGNVPAGTIIAMVSAVPDVAGCYNSSPTYGGSDRETDIDLVTRIKAIYLGNNVGTVRGYYTEVLTNLNVTDVKVVGPEDTTFAHRAYAGVVDILIRGVVAAQPDVERYVYTSGVAYYIPLKQPLNMLASGSFQLVTPSETLVEGTHYRVSQDIGAFGGSVQASDKFDFISGVIANGTTITFTYTYNSLVESVQNALSAETTKVVNADVLVKAARARLIDVSATIKLLSGYTATEVADSVRNNVINFLNSYLVSQEVQQSDVINVMTDTSGVDAVLVPLTKLQENPQTGNITQDDDGSLIIPADSYAAAGDVFIYVQ